MTEGFSVFRPDPDRLKYAFWQYGCVVFCDQQEKFMTREKAAEWYRKLNPPPPSPWLEAAGAALGVECSDE